MDGGADGAGAAAAGTNESAVKAAAEAAVKAAAEAAAEAADKAATEAAYKASVQKFIDFCDEPVDKTGETADADRARSDAGSEDAAGADAAAGTAGGGETNGSGDEDDSGGAGELIDVLELGYTHEDLVRFQKDSGGQFKTFARSMINEGDGVEMNDLDSEDQRNIAKTLAKFFVAVDSPGSANETSVIKIRNFS